MGRRKEMLEAWDTALRRNSKCTLCELIYKANHLKDIFEISCSKLLHVRYIVGKSTNSATSKW